MKQQITFIKAFSKIQSIQAIRAIVVLMFISLMPSLGFSQVLKYVQTGEEFSGPFKSWKNVKTDFGAKGDGITDDAPAINAALKTLSNSAKDSSLVLYFPAGTYLLKDSLNNTGGNYQGMNIVGEDPATTIISWGGAANTSAMFNLQGWYLRVSRLTFEGNNNVIRGIFKTGGFSTHNEFSDLVFKDFKTGIGLDLTGGANGQAENTILRCHFINCSTGISSCNWNSLDHWVWYCLFQDCNTAINQCDGYFQIYDNVFLRSKNCDISSSPYKNVISGNTSINSKCFFNGYETFMRGNHIYSNVDSFYCNAGSNTVMFDNLIRATRDSLAPVHVGNPNMFIGNTVSQINSKWSQWPIQPPYNIGDHGGGGAFYVGKQIEKAIDGNAATSFGTQAQPFGIKWNCPVKTQKTVIKYTVSAPLSSGGTSPLNFQLLASNNWSYKWDTLDIETNQSFTGGGNPYTYTIKSPNLYSMYELIALPNQWPWNCADHFGGRSIDNTTAESGTYSEKMVLSAAPRYVFQDIKIHADSSYVVSGWVKSTAVSTHAYILVLWYPNTTPSNPAATATGYIQVDTIAKVTGTTAWTNYTKTVIAPSGGLSAQLYLTDDFISTSSGTAWFDNFSFRESIAPKVNLALDSSFEGGGVNTYQQNWQVNELTLLDGSSTDITKDPNGFVSGADETWGQFYPLDNMAVDTSAIQYPDTITLPGTPQNLSRKVFEVVKGTGNDATEIQSKIDSAALLPLGNKPVVHIPFGQYSIKTGITVPANSDMQIIGDGSGLGYGATVTTLNWAGAKAGPGPLLELQGPNRATIKDLLLNVPYTDALEAFVIDNADQVGGRIYGQEFNAGGPQSTQPCDIGLLSDGIENSDITMMCFYPGFGNTAMVQANGGPVLSSGGNTNGQISLLGGATGNSQNLFNVTNGGRMDAEGMWNEGDFARTSGLVNLSNTFGKLSVACMSWNLLKHTFPMVSTDNFSGTFTFLMNHMNQEPWSYIPMIGSGTNCNILSGYNDWGLSNSMGRTTDSTWQDSTLPAANADFIGNAGAGGMLDVVVSKVHNTLPDTTSVLNDMMQLRFVRTTLPNDMTPGVTDVKLFRVVAWGAQNQVAAHFNSGTVTGVNTLTNSADKLELYPNPAKNQLTVSTEEPIENITITNVLGQNIFNNSFTDTKAMKQTFDVSGLIAGIYFVTAKSGGKTLTKKFIVVR
ncbi:MAG TPA: glycosyl hydrolase family 28-related protein [Bacteroidia bacterium]|nr:glycosyl hydrolase family 28-related protein [Bacteroidia bacterium]